MADLTIPQLSDIPSINDNTLFPVDSGTQSYKMSYLALKEKLKSEDWLTISDNYTIDYFFTGYGIVFEQAEFTGIKVITIETEHIPDGGKIFRFMRKGSNHVLGLSARVLVKVGTLDACYLFHNYDYVELFVDKYGNYEIIYQNEITFWNVESLFSAPELLNPSSSGGAVLNTDYTINYSNVKRRGTLLEFEAQLTFLTNVKGNLKLNLPCLPELGNRIVSGAWVNQTPYLYSGEVHYQVDGLSTSFFPIIKGTATPYAENILLQDGNPIAFTSGLSFTFKTSIRVWNYRVS